MRPAPEGLRFKPVLLREAALKIALSFVGTQEQGGNNRGPLVSRFLRDVGLPAGYSWCAAFVSYVYHLAYKTKVAWASAGVLQILDYAQRNGWVVARPRRGDLVCYDFSGDGVCNDHIGIVIRVLRLGPVKVIKTVEGNTASGVSGSQADGGGVFIRTRTVKSSSVRFVRVPGNAPLDH